eukprot:jgi/Ulvmu1/2305/UM013_0153.1
MVIQFVGEEAAVPKQKVVPCGNGWWALRQVRQWRSGHAPAIVTGAAIVEERTRTWPGLALTGADGAVARAFSWLAAIKVNAVAMDGVEGG